MTERIIGEGASWFTWNNIEQAEGNTEWQQHPFGLLVQLPTFGSNVTFGAKPAEGYSFDWC